MSKLHLCPIPLDDTIYLSKRKVKGKEVLLHGKRRDVTHEFWECVDKIMEIGEIRDIETSKRGVVKSLYILPAPEKLKEIITSEEYKTLNKIMNKVEKEKI